MSENVFAGELTLTNAQFTTHLWEDALRRLAENDRSNHVRSLRLDENPPLSNICERLADTLKKLGRLCELSLCDCRLEGNGVGDILSALGSVPAFAKPHAEVWAPIEVVASAPAQGAKLCLMRNNIRDDALGLAAGLGSSTCLRGVMELALNGNEGVADAGVGYLARIFPSLRKLHLGRTGIMGDGFVGVIDRHWPMLEALALNGTMAKSTDGFIHLCKALQQRASNAQTKKLQPPKELLAANPKLLANGFVHLDVREIWTISPRFLEPLQRQMQAYSTDHRGTAWIVNQSFGGGRYRSEGLVLRTELEEKLTLRLRVELDRQGDGHVSSSAGSPGPFFVELEDVLMKTSVVQVVLAVVQASNTKAAEDAAGGRGGGQAATLDQQRAAAARAFESGSSSLERRIRAYFTESRFPFAFSSGLAGARAWHEVCVEAPRGTPREGRDEMQHVAVGTCLHESREAKVTRAFDHALGAPRQLGDAHKIVEFEVRLRLEAKDEMGGQSSSSHRGGAMAAAGGRKRKAVG
jgi:hypothetical protein